VELHGSARLGSALSMKTVRQWRAPLLLALGLTLLVVVAGELGAVLSGRGGE